MSSRVVNLTIPPKFSIMEEDSLSEVDLFPTSYDSCQLLGINPARSDRRCLNCMEISKKKKLLLAGTILLVLINSAIIIGIVTFAKQKSYPTTTTATISTTPIETSSTSTTITTTPAITSSTFKPTTTIITKATTTRKTTTTTKPTTTSRTTTELPYCHYKNWHAITCPDGDGWACWADDHERYNECTYRGWSYGWGTIERTWPLEDCYCCSSIPCTYD